ncbi:two-component system response regulator [bacterium endosymbiont of Escarpia laminata]|nr:MAG: two-component system response regulator [bacterium endosymbiont of Escarpia laminata]
MKKSILFVDDERSVLQGLQRSLRGQRKEWEMVFVDGGTEALKMVNEKNFDAIVTDMRMPGINGAELLGVLAADRPELVRIILSGHSDEELIMQSAGTAHQFLTKPCDVDTLKETLNRAFALKRFLGNGQLHFLVTGMTSLPSIPKTYQEIMTKLRSPETSLYEIGEIIGKDPAMTAKILQLVNSAFFGLGRHISDSKEAATLLGLDVLKALVLSVGIFSQFDQQRVKDTIFSIESLLDHSLVVARLAQRIAQAEGADKAVADDCFLAGILHDIGILILEQNFSEDYVKVRALAKDQDMALCLAEQEVYGTTHGAVGAYLLGLWALPNSVVEAVAFHHQPGLSSGNCFCPLSAVHVADVLIHQTGLSGGIFPKEAKEVDREFLARVGGLDRLNTWERLQPEENEA